MKAVLMICCLLAANAYAQSSQDAESALERAAVTIDGRTLFYVRGLSGRSAPERARVIAGRIVSAARDPGVDPAKLRVVETPESTQILAGQQLLMTVSDSDAGTEKVERHTMVRVYSELMAATIATYRAERLPERRTEALIRVLVATAVFVSGFWLVFWGTRRLGGLFEGRLRPRLPMLRLKSVELVDGQGLWGALRLVGRLLRLVLLLLMVYLYVQYSLSQFPRTRAIGDTLLAHLVGPLDTMGSAIVDFLPSLLFLVVLFVVVRVLLRIIALYFAALGSGKATLANFAPEWSVPTYRLVRVGVIAFALVVAYPHIPGSGSDAFKGLSIFFGILLSIGSSSFVANSVAGYALIYRRLFAIGERVRIGDEVGDVIEMRMQVTRLRSIKNEEIIIPNSTILNSVVLNYSAMARTHGLILHTTVGIGYETPWRQVEGMLLMAASRTPGMLTEPSPFVLQRALGDFCVTYELNVYTSNAGGMAQQYHALHTNILDVFNEYGVQIMTPAYEGDPQEPKVVPKELWYAEPSLPSPKETPPTGR